MSQPEEILAATASIRDRLLANTFVERARDRQIDPRAYDQLLALLDELKTAWRGQPVVDKAIVQCLYYLAPIVRGVAASWEHRDPEQAHELDEMGIMIDALILDLLHDPAPVSEA